MKSKIDKLARKKNNLMILKETVKHKMQEVNSAIETRIKILENTSYNNKVEADKKMVEIQREIDKVIREINSEQIYVNEVANSEKGDNNGN